LTNYRNPASNSFIIINKHGPVLNVASLHQF